MKFSIKLLPLLLISLFVLNAFSLLAQDAHLSTDSVIRVVTLDDVLLDSLLNDTLTNEELKSFGMVEQPKYRYVIFNEIVNHPDSFELIKPYLLRERADSLMRIPTTRNDTLLYLANPLTLPLIYMGKESVPVWDGEHHFQQLLYGKKFELVKRNVDDIEPAGIYVTKLRNSVRTRIANEAIALYETTVDRLPELSTFLNSNSLKGREVHTLNVYDDKIQLGKTKIDLEEMQKIFWIKKANAMLQFSQNHVSTNWYQGGNSSYAFLSIFNGELNYDNRKNIIWENRVEWRVGYNRIQSDKALRSLNINDDMLRYNTKFGLKAGGNWYYSVSGEATTQLFNNYRSFDSDKLKSRLFTPIRANLGVGMDYKYKNFSMMIAPISFKYIYVNDTVLVDQNQFGIKKGENQLKQLGSSMRSELKLKPSRNWNIDSRLNFYTDYKKVEVDLEVVNNFVINRFLTTRLLLNPRFDNTIILKPGEKSKIQYKELLSIGFSYRFI